jgi:hypothetical protein
MAVPIIGNEFESSFGSNVLGPSWSFAIPASQDDPCLNVPHRNQIKNSDGAKFDFQRINNVSVRVQMLRGH